MHRARNTALDRALTEARRGDRAIIEAEHALHHLGQFGRHGELAGTAAEIAFARLILQQLGTKQSRHLLGRPGQHHMALGDATTQHMQTMLAGKITYLLDVGATGPMRLRALGAAQVDPLARQLLAARGGIVARITAGRAQTQGNFQRQPAIHRTERTRTGQGGLRTAGQNPGLADSRHDGLLAG